MALKANLVFSGIPISGAYVRMFRLQGGKDDAEWVGMFRLYASEETCWPSGRTKTLQRPAAAQPEPTDEHPNPETVMEDYEVAAAPSEKILSGLCVQVPYEDADPRPLLWAAARAQLEQEFSATSIENA